MSWTRKGSLPVDFGPRLRVGLHEAATMIGNELVRAARAGILTGKKTGRFYSGNPNQSSAPGEFSANQTGNLLNSIQWRMSGASYLAFYSDSPHAGFQEYGTTKMAARPNLKMAIDESDGMIRNLLDQVLLRAMGR
jgi:hypothetical protein